MGQQHDLPRHRLRLRRPPDRAALPRARAGLGAGAQDLLRAGEAVPRRTGRAGRRHRGRRRAARHRRRARQARRSQTRLHGPAHDPRGERRGRAGGDEPVRGRPALAALPAADDGAGARRRPRRVCSSTRPRRSPTTGATGVAAGGLRGEAHGLARGRRSSAATAGRERTLRRDRRRDGRVLHPHRAAVLLRRRHGARRSWRRLRAAIDAPGLWDELDTDWLLLDGELLPWSAKAEELLRDQYAAVGAAARAALAARRGDAASRAAERGLDVGDLLGARPDAGAPTSTRSSTPTAGTAGRSTASTACASRRSRCWPPRAGRTARPRPRLAPGRSPTGWPTAAPGAGPADTRPRGRRHRPEQTAAAVALVGGR